MASHIQLLSRLHIPQVLRSPIPQIDVQVQKCDILVSVAVQSRSAVHASKVLARSVTWAAAKAPDVSFQSTVSLSRGGWLRCGRTGHICLLSAAITL